MMPDNQYLTNKERLYIVCLLKLATDKFLNEYSRDVVNEMEDIKKLLQFIDNLVEKLESEEFIVGCDDV